MDRLVVTALSCWIGPGFGPPYPKNTSPKTKEEEPKKATRPPGAVAGGAEDEAVGSISLGSPKNWTCRPVEDGQGGFVPSKICKTENPNVAVAETKNGKKALCIRCPHRGIDLTVHGRLDEASGEIRCKHKGYSWCSETGQTIGIGCTGDGGPIKLYDVVIDEDGIAHTSAEAAK